MMNTHKLKLSLASMALALATASPNSFAIPIVVGAGWVEFGFGSVGSSFSDEPFTFTLPSAGELRVTDAFQSGDQFEVFNLAASLGLTSVPTSQGDQIGSDYDAAFADPRWSSGSYLLAAGDYSITGLVTASPFGGGGAALRVDRATTPEVPLPGTVVLLGLGLAAVGLSRRKPA